MWKNIVEPERVQNYDVIRRMRRACCVPKATNTLSQSVKFIAFPLQKWLHKTPQCYVIRALPVLLNIELVVHNTRTAVTV